jgi:hypothetical protein
MTPNRYAVPLEQLDSVRVAESEQVSAQPDTQHPDSTSWAAPALHPFGDGMTGDADGD